MSKINVEFDTKEKTLAVKIDGKPVPNIIGVNLSKSYYSDDEDEFSCSLVTMTKDEANDIRTYTQVMATESKEAKIHDTLPSADFPGMLESRGKQQVAAGQRRNRGTGMIDDDSQIRKGRQHAVHEQADDGASRVEVELHHLRADAWHHVAAAARERRMNKDDGFAPVQFAPDRREDRVAGIFIANAAEDADAIRVQRVEGVLDFAQRAVDVRHRDGGEQPEPPGMVDHHLRDEVVHAASDRP